MPKLDVLINNLSSGELSPLALGRTEFARYRTGAKTILNWRILLQGGARTRYGTRYVATVKDSGQTTILLPFEPTDTTAYVLEVGDGYFRYYTTGARLEVASVPVETDTPYLAADLRRLRTAQANDVMIIAHGGYAPRRLSRLTATTFELGTINFTPPPTFESGFEPNATLTPSATTGSVTLTASASVFLASDAQRVITSGTARAVITTVTNATTVTATVLDAFASTSAIAAGSWTLRGSPLAKLLIDDSAGVTPGAQVALQLLGIQPLGSELLTNGDFSTGLSAWDDLSSPALASGTHDGADNNHLLIDSTADFAALGVVPGMIVQNDTDGCFGVVLRLMTTTNPNDTIVFDPPGSLTGGTDNDFDVGDAYSIEQGGSASPQDGQAILFGGTMGGVGWIEQDVTTVAGLTYQVEFDAIGQPLSSLAGSATGIGDLFAEAQFLVGNDRTYRFEASSTTSFVGFRNNQNVLARLDNVSVKQLSVEGWRSTDVGRYVRAGGGLFKILSVTSAFEVAAEVVIEPTATPEDADTDFLIAAGAWKLESPSWSDALGWPSVVVLYEGRLYFAASATFPQTIWGSAVDDLFNFFVGAEADLGVEFRIQDSGGNIVLNQIRALMPAENMLALTSTAEYRLIGAGDDPLTSATPPRVRVQSTYGTDFVQPLKVGPALLFVQRQGSALREMAFQEPTQGFIARNLTRLSGHLLQDQRILEVAYESEPEPIVWSIRDDGTLLGLTYDLLEQVEGWHRHTTQGLFESQTILPHPTALADQQWLLVNRTIDGQTVRMVEVVDPYAAQELPVPFTDPTTGEAITGWEGLTVDSAVVYDLRASPSATLTGLEHLEGETVAIVADGAVYPSQVVSGGQVTVGTTLSGTVWAGLPYTCTLRTLPLELGIQGGTTIQDQQVRFAKVAARVHESIGLTIQGQIVPFRTPSHALGQGVPPFTGDVDLMPPGGWKTAATIDVVQHQPLPATLLAIIAKVDFSNE